MASFRLPESILWWAQVTVTPEDSKTAVLSKGIRKGFIGVIPVGGQETPNSTVGASLLWKKAQKNAKKKHTSDVIKSTIPYRNPFLTGRVWNPWKVASRIISRHQFIIVSTRRIVPKINRAVLFTWNQRIRPEVIINALIAPVKGQGLWSTRWYGCWWVIIYRFCTK